MAMQETIKTGRKYRKCIDNTSGNKKWERYSFWSKASDVEFNDGTTAENKLGSFKGVTTNENQSAGYAADVTLLKSIKTALTNSITSVSTSVTNLNNLITSVSNRLGGMRFYEDSTGKYVVGADSVPKKLGSVVDGLVTDGRVIGGSSLYLAPGGQNITTHELVWDSTTNAPKALDRGDYLVTMGFFFANGKFDMDIIQTGGSSYPSTLIGYAGNMTVRAFVFHVETPVKLYAKFTVVGNVPGYGAAFGFHETIKIGD